MKIFIPEILSRFDNILKFRKLPFPLYAEYRKWLRYFLDFRAKYPLSEERSVQVRLFSEKLRSKGQTESQVKQAADAASLFFTIQQKVSAVASPAASGAAPDSVPHSVPEQLRGQDPLPCPP